VTSDAPAADVPVVPSAPALSGAEPPAGSFRALPRGIRWLCIVFVVAGVASLLRGWLECRSLWYDEATLSNHILESDLSTLFAFIDRQQGAPFGFIIATKLVTNLAGTSEMALRLLPLLSAIACMVLVPVAAARWLTPFAVPVATACIAFSPGFRYYGNEAKPYGPDALIMLLILMAGEPFLRGTIPLRKTVLPAVLGALALWFSFPAIFGLASIGVFGALAALRAKDKDRFLAVVAPAAAWLLMFLGLCALTLNQLHGNEYLEKFWAHGMAPFPPRTKADFLWYSGTAVVILDTPLGVGFPYIAAGILGAGAAFLLLKRPVIGVLLCGPLLFALFASMMTAYPLRQRMVVFMVPILALLLAEGTALLRLPGHRAWTMGLRTLVAAALLLGPAVDLALSFKYPVHREESRQLLEVFAANAGPGDVLWVYDGAIPTFLHNRPRLDLDRWNYRLGIRYRSRGARRADIEGLPPQRRVWALFSHVIGEVGPKDDERDILLRRLLQRRKELQRWNSVGASLHLLGSEN
jgi:hypothetical protein